MKPRRENGFTIIELMIVIVVIGVLISIAIPNYVGIIDKAEKVACKANIRSLELARTYNYFNNSTYGSSMADLIQVFSEIGFIGDTTAADLICPSGGDYVFSTGDYHVTCSIIEHNN